MNDIPKEFLQLDLLHRAAACFFELSPWKWVKDADVFGVVDEDSGRTSYCSILGCGGNIRGLAAYLGSEGLSILDDMIAMGPPEDPQALMDRQTCLILQFGKADMLESEDKTVANRLGRKYGKKDCPLFRSYRPMYEPTFLNDQDVQHLRICIQQSIAVALEIKENPDLLSPREPRSRFHRQVKKGPDGPFWSNTFFRPADPVVRPLPLFDFDELKFARLRELLKKTDEVWEVDFRPVPVPTMENGSAYLKRLFLVADRGSGKILASDILKPWERYERYGPLLLAAFEKAGRIPKQIFVRDSLLQVLAYQKLKLLNIEQSCLSKLPLIDVSAENLIKILMRR